MLDYGKEILFYVPYQCAAKAPAENVHLFTKKALHHQEAIETLKDIMHLSHFNHKQ